MPTPVTDPDIIAQLNAPQRTDVPSSPRVWGDQEAVNAGLYERPVGPSGLRPVTDPGLLQQLNGQRDRAPVRITVNPVSSRFGELKSPENPDALQSGLEQRTLEMTRGPELPPASQMAGDLANLVPAASQGTSPHVSNYGGNIVSTDVLQDDAGNIQYRDPQTGEIKLTDNTKHVALRDPADGVVKIFNRTDTTNEGPAVGISRVLGPGLAAGAVTARPAIAAAKNVVPRASDIFSTAKPHYRAFDAEAARSAPMLADDAKIMVDRLQNALDTAHLPSEVAKQVHDTVALIGKKANGETALSQLQYVKRAVGNLFKSPDENVRSGAAVASKEIGRMISETSRSAGRSLKTADDIHSTARAVQDLQRKGDIANLRTGRAGYGGNAVNNKRTAVEKIVEAAVNGRQTPYKPNEIQAMRDIVDGNWITNTARNIGAMSPSKGVMQIGLGTATMGASAILGSAANKLATILTGRQLDRLNELVAKRSPAYSQAVAKAVARFERAQLELANNPSPNKMAAYASASRSLSSGLTKDGIHITSGDLIRSIAGPPKAAADPEQDQAPPVPGQ